MSGRSPAVPRYGEPDEIAARQWRETHVDPGKVRAWCTETSRPVPRGTFSRELIAEYLAERAYEIPLPGHPNRAEAHAALPILTTSYMVRLGPLQVIYGPCPRCRRPTCALPGQPLPPCLYCQTSRTGS